ncbi:hypothetical protein L9F63_020005 [Diploptera punctata]|uniref:Peptidase S1 domain-containing protein n=1 Tax=Diploptera punctata TaxID=6984 RepID=A0AAD7ZTF8_DIPPU|nr:hypothetical protein L9F63_020005 [Diploptera punctata]
MALQKFYVLSCALLCIILEAQEVLGTSLIIGGRNVCPGEIPYQVAIHRKYYFGSGSYHWCGGSIISRRHVLTAAHGISGVPVSEFLIFAGVINNTWQSEEPTKVLRNVSAVHIHEDFNLETYFNDIAILTVTEDFPTDNHAISTIPLAEEHPAEGTECTTSGWGKTDNDTLPSILQVVKVPFISHNTCQEIYTDKNDDSILPGMVCAGYPEGGKDACGGDSGGPLACGGNLVGIVSAGEGCGLENYPGVYASVPYYKKWIADIVKE